MFEKHLDKKILMYLYLERVCLYLSLKININKKLYKLYFKFIYFM